MAPKAVDAFKTFTAGVLAKLPPEQRGKAEEYLNGILGVEPLAAAFGDGVLAQAEFSRLSDDLRNQRQELDTLKTTLDTREAGLNDWHGNLTAWHTQNKAALDEYTRLKAAGGNGNPNPKPGTGGATPPPGGLTEEQLNERIAASTGAFLGFQRDQNLISREHYEKFKEIVDLDPLLRHPRIAELGLVGVYNLVHKDRLEQHQQATVKAREDQIRADERQKVLASTAQMPYPTPTGAGSGSPLDALAINRADGVVDAAVVEYNRLQQQRMSPAGRT